MVNVMPGMTLLDKYARLYHNINKASQSGEFGRALYNIGREKQKHWIDMGKRAFDRGEDVVPYLGEAFVEVPNEMIRLRAGFINRHPRVRPSNLQFTNDYIDRMPRIGNLEENMPYLPDYVYETGLSPEDIQSDYYDYKMREARKRWPDVFEYLDRELGR